MLLLIGQTALAADNPIDALAAADSPLKDTDRIVFLGDSITQVATSKEGYITVLANALKEHHKDVTLVNAGISGHKVPDLQARLDKDVLAKKPTLVLIYIGINDVWHSQSGNGTPKDKFEAGLKDLIDRIQKTGAIVVLATPTVIGEKTDGTNPLDKMLDEYADVSRAVAKENKLVLCDLHEAFQTYLKKNNPDNNSKGILTGDTVHLSPAGNKLVAETAAVSIAAALKARNSGGGAAADFVPLFNGKNLDGWHVLNCDVAVEDGSLVIKDGNGFVYADGKYTDFVLEIDWKARRDKKYDSGIYFRSDLPAKGQNWPARYQVNLQEGYEGNIVAHNKAKSTGLIKAGEWNHFQLTVVGSKASLEINGKPAWAVDDIQPPTGVVGIQVEVPGGGQFEFKNIRIKTIDAK
jgi:lysophospholipase L1-like esterase